MKITRGTQTVWNLDSFDTIIGTNAGRRYFVRLENRGSFYIAEYTKDEMKEIYGLTDDQFENIKHSGI